MFSILPRLKHAVTWMLEQVLIYTVAFMVLAVLWGICTRFILGAPSRWTEEVATNLLIWVSLLGAAVAFDRQEHLGLDYFTNKLDSAAKTLVAIVIQVAIIAFAGLAMIYGGYVLVSETLAASQLTPVLGIKMGYIYLAVPVSGAFILLYSVERLVEIFTGNVEADERETPTVANDDGEAI